MVYEEDIICRKRFDNWVKDSGHTGFHRSDVRKYNDLYYDYIRCLDPIQLMQEWRSGHDWKREKIMRLWKFYEEEFNEKWY